MVAISNHPDSPLEPAIRLMHPFPIFERYVSRDIHLPSSHPAQSSSPSPPVAVIKANTQVIMFTSDFLSSPYHWNIFGAGERICSGMHFALPFLKILYQSFHPLIRSEQETANHTSSARLNIRFRPELYHRYSGRNNDGKTSISELVYLFRLIIGIFYTKIMSKMFGFKSVEEEEEEEEQQLQQQQQQSQVDKKVK